MSKTLTEKIEALKEAAADAQRSLLPKSARDGIALVAEVAEALHAELQALQKAQAAPAKKTASKASA